MWIWLRYIMINNMEKKIKETKHTAGLSRERSWKTAGYSEVASVFMALGWPGLCDLMCRTYEVPEVARPQSKQLGLWCLMMFGDASRAENKGNSIVTPSPIVANNGSECKNAQVFFSLGDVWSSAALADQRPAARVHLHALCLRGLWNIVSNLSHGWYQLLGSSLGESTRWTSQSKMNWTFVKLQKILATPTLWRASHRTLGLKDIHTYFAIFMPTFLCYGNGSPVFVFVLWNRGHDRFPSATAWSVIELSWLEMQPVLERFSLPCWLEHSATLFFIICPCFHIPDYSLSLSSFWKICLPSGKLT